MKATIAKIPLERVEALILLIRGEKVILDSDLAALYGVSTKRLNEQVRRNRKRLPENFMLQITVEEAIPWRQALPFLVTHHSSLMTHHSSPYPRSSAQIRGLFS